eukprot:Opistho-2@62487
MHTSAWLSVVAIIMASNANAPVGFNWRPFVYGGFASMAAEILTFPIDTTKTRLQLQGQQGTAAAPRYSGMINAGITIARDEGVLRLYRGIAPALLRQASYGTIKIGVYQSLKRLIVKDPKDETLLQNICAGALAGIISSSIATPTDVVKVRMQAHSAVPRYSGVFNAFATIFREEGVKGLWKGVGPTAQRAAVITSVELPVYDTCKRNLINRDIMKEGIAAHFASSFTAGFAGAIASNPIDVVKTRLMNQSSAASAAGGAAVYKGSLDCLAKTIKHEGFAALYKGFIPNYVRLGPWNVAFFMVYEQLKKLHY